MLAVFKITFMLSAYYVINIYAPNKISEIKNFFTKLLQNIKHLNLKQNIIICSDFNTSSDNQDKDSYH